MTFLPTNLQLYVGKIKFNEMKNPNLMKNILQIAFTIIVIAVIMS